MKYIILLLVLVPCFAFADDDQLILDGGVGVFHSADKGLSETKLLTLGVQETIWGPLKDRALVGGWIDDTGDGKSGSALIGGQLGFEVNNNGWVGSVFSGPAIISNTDVLLGGNFEFVDDLHLGIQDQHGYYIGVMYRHISSAGLEFPNIGRDFIALELRW
jgi:hypothetical protein